MMYDNKDKHPTVEILKKKGWVLFEVYSSRFRNEWGGWRIDTAVAFGTEHEKTHKEINGKYLGTTLKEALKTLKSDKFPLNVT